MADEPKDVRDDEAELARARELILQRRNRLVVAAMTGLGVLSTSCSRTSVCLSMVGPEQDASVKSDSGVPSVCLGAPYEDAGPSVCLDIEVPDDAGPSVCLSAPVKDAGPSVCLDVWVPDDAGPLDAGPDAGDGGSDAGPTVCLSPPYPDEAADESDKPVAT